MKNIVIQTELPLKLTARAQTYVKEVWATDFNELLADALRRFLESHSSRVTENFLTAENAKTTKNIRIHLSAISAFFAVKH